MNLQMLDKPKEALVPASPRLRRVSSGRVVRSDRWQRVADVMPRLVRDARSSSEGNAPRGWGSLPDLALVSGSGNTTAAAVETTDAALATATQSLLELQALPVSVLKNKARRLGVSETALDEADDAEDVKIALVGLITAESTLQLGTTDDLLPTSPLQLGITAQKVAEPKAKASQSKESRP